MDRHLAAKVHRFGVADLRNSLLLRAIYALNRRILIDNLFDPDLFRVTLSIKTIHGIAGSGRLVNHLILFFHRHQIFFTDTHHENCTTCHIDG